MSTAGPQKFKKQGKAFIGYAIAFRMPSGAEVIMFCPTQKSAVEAAVSLGMLAEVDIKEVKRAALGPVELLSGAATQIAEGE